MDDTSRDLFLSHESLESHLPQMNSGWWGIYTLTFYPKISLWDKWLGPSPLLFFPLSYDLSQIIDIYP
jgi:hypothetical protein